MRSETYLQKRVGLTIVTLLMAIALIVASTCSPVLAQAQPEQETNNGVGYVTYTGDAYPTSIVDAGYDAEGQKMWLNIDFEATTAPTANMAWNWSYTVEIFDTNSNLIGSKTGYVVGAANATTASVTNLDVTLTSTLTAEFRIVVTVTDLTEV